VVVFAPPLYQQIKRIAIMNNTIQTIAQTVITVLFCLSTVPTIQAQSINSANRFSVSIDASDTSNPQISWSTSKEVNTSFFILEYGEDSTNLENSTVIKAAGSSSYSKSYDYDHIYMNGAPVFIRLTLVTMEGEREQVNFVVDVYKNNVNPVQTNFITSN
jgi:hypothetical protein